MNVFKFEWPAPQTYYVFEFRQLISMTPDQHLASETTNNSGKAKQEVNILTAKTYIPHIS